MTLMIGDMGIEGFCTTNDLHLNQGGVYTIRLKNYVARYSDGRIVKPKEYAYTFVTRPRYELNYKSGVVAVIAVSNEIKPIVVDDTNKSNEPPLREYTVHVCHYRDELFEMADGKVHFKFRTTEDDVECNCEIVADIDSIGDFYPWGKYGPKFLCGGAFGNKLCFKNFCNELRRGMLYRMEYEPMITGKGMINVDDLFEQQEPIICDSHKFYIYRDTKYLNRYLDITNSPEGVIFSVKLYDAEIHTFRKCEHGNRWHIYSDRRLDPDHIELATDCMECFKKGKPYRIIPPPMLVPKFAIDNSMRLYEYYEHIYEHLKLNDASQKCLWGFDTTDEASTLQEIYFGD